MKRGWQVIWVLMWVGCAGDLRDPGRFSFLYDQDGGRTDAGSSSGTKDAGEPGGADASMMTPPAAPPMCVTALFKMKCGNIGCHAAGGTQVDLVSANVAARLVGKSSSTRLPCKGRTLVDSTGGDSLLIDKIMDPPPCGELMPLGGTKLPDADRSCLTGWVSSLANSN